jgi:SAM-dependent methyltransferase
MSVALRSVRKAVQDPRRAVSFLKRRYRDAFLWERYYERLPNPKRRGGVPQDAATLAEVIRQLEQESYHLRRFRIDASDFRQCLNRAGYSQFSYYDRGRAESFIEKALEHYLAAKFLGLSAGDVYLDIASADSPAPEVYARLYGCRVYRQDLTYPEGIHGNVIGGDAANLPLPDGFATKMALHCSFEHFERDSDIRFIRETDRLLSPGGRLCILPLYLFTEYAIQTDPVVLPNADLAFDRQAVLYCAKGFGNRHSRFYDIPQFTSRIRNSLGSLSLTIYVIENARQVDPSCYANFAAVFEKEP